MTKAYFTHDRKVYMQTAKRRDAIVTSIRVTANTETVCLALQFIFITNRRRGHNATIGANQFISAVWSLEKHEREPRHTFLSLIQHWTWVQRKGKKYCRQLTSVASLVHHQHIGANANYPTDIALELPVGQPDTAGRGEGLGFGARLWAVHLGPRGIDHAQVFRALLLLHAIHVTGQPTLLITASLNFNVTGWKRGQGGGEVGATV